MTETQHAIDTPQALRSVNRALDVLQTLGSAEKEGMTVAEVATAIGVSKSTAFALLQGLLARFFVADIRLGGSRRYKLGLALVPLGDHAAAGIGVSQLAMPLLRQLTDETGLTSRLAIMDEGFAVSIARVEAPGIFRLAPSLGLRELPHCSALGKSMLALMPPPKVLKLLKRIGMPRRTEHTITVATELMKDLVLVAERGFAFDDEEDNIGVACVAAAISDRKGDGVAAISVTCLKGGRTQADLIAIGEIVHSYAERISQMLGASGRDD